MGLGWAAPIVTVVGKRRAWITRTRHGGDDSLRIDFADAMVHVISNEQIATGIKSKAGGTGELRVDGRSPITAVAIGAGAGDRLDIAGVNAHTEDSDR